jgi:hypothetical protein
MKNIQEQSNQEQPKERLNQTPIQSSSQRDSAQLSSVQSKAPQRSGQPTSASSSSSSVDVHEAVRRRAYQIYEQRGMTGGSEIEDWLQAESELLDMDGHEKAA